MKRQMSRILKSLPQFYDDCFRLISQIGIQVNRMTCMIPMVRTVPIFISSLVNGTTSLATGLVTGTSVEK